MTENKGSSFIRRKRKENNFTQLPNEMLRDENLSWKARGLLAYMLSMPDDWVFYSSELVKHSKNDGEASLRTAMKELKEAGYMAKQAIRNDKGKIIKWETYVDETPFYKQENNVVQNGTFQHVDNQHVDNLKVDNHTLLIPIFTNNDLNNNNNIKDMPETKVSSDIDLKFEQWWNVYDKKTDKKKALSSFKAVIKKYDFDELIINTKKYANKFTADKKFQRNPSTFLNNYSPDDIMFNDNQQFGFKSQSNYSTNQHQGASSYVVQDKDLYGDVD